MSANKQKNRQQQHTPGPWTIHNRDVVAGERTEKGWRAVATIPSGPIQIGLITGDEATGNARLIAAAPDLLGACKEALSLLSDLCTIEAAQNEIEKDDARAFTMLRGAIAKARGEDK